MECLGGQTDDFAIDHGQDDHQLGIGDCHFPNLVLARGVDRQFDLALGGLPVIGLKDMDFREHLDSHQYPRRFLGFFGFFSFFLAISRPSSYKMPTLHLGKESEPKKGADSEHPLGKSA